MDDIFEELINSPNLLDPPVTEVGSEYENPVVLNRNDASGQRGIWAQESVYGYWDVDVNEGLYDIRFKFIEPLKDAGRMVLESGTLVQQMEVQQAGLDVVEMKDIHLPEMKGTLRPFYQAKEGEIFPFWVELNKQE
jgi:arylsulfatase